jgi:hypothetical protein
MVMSVTRRAMPMRMTMMTMTVVMTVHVFGLCMFRHDLLSYHFK